MFLWITTVAQKPYADSLKQVLSRTDDPRLKVDLLCDIAYDLFDFDDDAAQSYARQAKKLAEENNYLTGVKYALTIMGLGDFSFGDYQKALQNLYASKNTKAEQSPEKAAYNLMLIGSTHRDLATYDSAELYYRKAIEVVGENGDPYYLGSFYRGLGFLKLIQWKNQEALEYLQKAEFYAQKNPGDYYVLMNIWALYGRLYNQLLDYEKADGYFQRMCEQEKKTRDFLLEIKCHLYESTKALRRGEHISALQEAFKALQISDIYRYPQQRVEVYTRIGFIYSELSQNSFASQYFFEGLKIGEKCGLQFEVADLYTKLAWVYKEELNFTSALDFLNKSEAIRSSIGDIHGVSECQNVRGLVYFLQKDYTQSLAEFSKALTIRKSMGNELNVTATMFNMALVYEAMGKNDLSLELQKQSMVIEEKLNNKLGLGISYNSLASLMTKMGKYSEAEYYLSKGNRLSKEIRSKVLRRNVYINFAKLYEATGRLKEAVAFHLKYESLNDSMYSESSSLKLAEMQALYQVEKKEQEIQRLDLQKKAQEVELNSQKSLAQQQRFVIAASLVSIVLLLIAGGLALRYYREKSRDNKRLVKLNSAILEQKEEIQAQSEELIEATTTISSINKELESKVETRTSELKQAYKELDTFFYRASHDFRRPITTFLGLAGVAKITVKDPVSLELFDKVSETAESLDKMLQKLQSISDVGAQQMIFKEVFIKELAEEILGSYDKQFQQKKIAVHLDVKEAQALISYPAMVKIIIENLIENAIHFAGVVDPYVKIKIVVDHARALIEIEDNGQGIHEEYKSRIFEMYFRANEHSKGNGLGLYIAKKAAEKLNGSIRFTSQYNKGTTFVVDLPNGEE
ncbi:hypothetical protein WSM22_24170 [Cytophagales bacterium WSM2-2]|nr:hypothetical protein WSM22_24170 [Cytophagales bacterium WSM2-2]